MMEISIFLATATELYTLLSLLVGRSDGRSVKKIKLAHNSTISQAIELKFFMLSH